MTQATAGGLRAGGEFSLSFSSATVHASEGAAVSSKKSASSSSPAIHAIGERHTASICGSNAEQSYTQAASNETSAL
eukprot:CAMPEP_0183371068 /NCGR_PEP_ID=MMETSP0164_2-20130417/104305_1 /TAXON_ID=221442 /ORGANISM="Coccolithus pelagicus ssp braarudi, Strain PLY182g" /LENGTH=76 /DNA_ID=CAMNT_0025547567 /DNA_START=150 /DNA_END=377 /DNA_ORIENTATION=+